MTTDRYAQLGHPAARSCSPSLHAAIAGQAGQTGQALVAQAAEAFFVGRGVPPATSAVLQTRQRQIDAR